MTGFQRASWFVSYSVLFSQWAAGFRAKSGTIAKGYVATVSLCSQYRINNVAGTNDLWGVLIPSA